jgi:succinate-semialdehyde dehydrogenase/glutarate-semialdehyde dehydrogenase
LASKCRSAGQTCAGAHRILAQNGVYDALTERLSETAAQMEVPDGFVPGAASDHRSK